MVVLVVIIFVILGFFNGYVFVKWKFFGFYVIFVLFLFGMFIFYQVIMILLLGMMLDIQQGVLWFVGILILVLCYVVYGIFICILIFCNYYVIVVFLEIVEVFRVDGVVMILMYIKIVLLVFILGFVVMFIWQFISVWNDFFFVLFLINQNNGLVIFGFNVLVFGQNLNYLQIMVGVFIVCLLIVVVYIVLGKYFVFGFMSGLVK